MKRRYEVVVTPEAETGIVAAFRYLRARSPLNAEKWLRALYQKIEMLEQMPERCGLAREKRFFLATRFGNWYSSLIESSFASMSLNGSSMSSMCVTPNSRPLGTRTTLDT